MVNGLLEVNRKPYTIRSVVVTEANRYLMDRICLYPNRDVLLLYVNFRQGYKLGGTALFRPMYIGRSFILIKYKGGELYGMKVRLSLDKL